MNKIIYYALIIILVICQFTDIWSTYYAINNGLGEECNPLVNYVISSIGLLPTLFLTKFFAFSIIYWIFLNKPSFNLKRLIPMFLLVLTYIFVLINNFHICKFI